MTAISEAEMVGRRFGKLTVLGLAERRGVRGKRNWLCRCECGRQNAVAGNSLRKGNTKSCGSCRPHAFKHGHSTKTVKTPTYHSWHAMKKRCSSSTRGRAPCYADKGISFDPRWKDFNIFLADMGERPAGHTLDRRDNDQGYSKANCRWATPTEQTRNRRVTLMFTHEGRTLPVIEWAKELGLSYSVAKWRFKRHGALELPA
jgi:hypothetical protein